MSEKEKMEAIYRQVQEQGVSPEAVAKYLLEKAEACLSSEKILPGMFVYADNTIRSEIIEGLQIKAVVGYVERNKVYAVCLWEEQLPWSSSYLQVRETRNLADGRKATLEIIKKAQEQNGKAEAVRWCYNYPYDDVESGEAFLPSESELQKIYSNKTAINAALEELGASVLSGWYWSSTENLDNSARHFQLDFGYKNVAPKNSNYYVRPMLVIEL